MRSRPPLPRQRTRPASRSTSRGRRPDSSDTRRPAPYSSSSAARSRSPSGVAVGLLDAARTACSAVQRARHAAAGSRGSGTSRTPIARAPSPARWRRNARAAARRRRTVAGARPRSVSALRVRHELVARDRVGVEAGRVEERLQLREVAPVRRHRVARGAPLDVERLEERGRCARSIQVQFDARRRALPCRRGWRRSTACACGSPGIASSGAGSGTRQFGNSSTVPGTFGLDGRADHVVERGAGQQRRRRRDVRVQRDRRDRNRPRRAPRRVPGRRRPARREYAPAHGRAGRGS